MKRSLIWTVAVILALPSIAMFLASFPAIVADRSRLRSELFGEFQGLPPDFWIWLGTSLLSLLVGLSVTVRRKGIGDGCRRLDFWTALGGTFGGLYLLSGWIVAFTRYNTRNEEWVGGVLLLYGAAVVAATILLRLGRYEAAHVVFALAGFLALPPGLMMILLAREIRDSIAADGLGAPAVGRF